MEDAKRTVLLVTVAIALFLCSCSARTGNSDASTVWECSECGHTFEDVNGEYAFCPRCGARVVGVGE